MAIARAIPQLLPPPPAIPGIPGMPAIVGISGMPAMVCVDRSIQYCAIGGLTCCCWAAAGPAARDSARHANAAGVIGVRIMVPSVGGGGVS